MSHRDRNTPFKGTYPDNPADRSDTGSRLRPVSDSLETVGFPSKGDKTLLDHKAQRTYYDSILKRYMQFCSSHSHDLEAAWASLPANASTDATRNPPSNLLTHSGHRQVPDDDLVSKIENLNLSVQQQSYSSQPQVPMKPTTTPSAVLSTILMSLRKLREGILATSSTTPVAFQQQVLIFSIRFAILARHPPSYFSSLRYLLNELHTNSNPLAAPTLIEFTSYLILDYACRQHSLGTAYTLLIQAKQRHTSQYSLVHRILNAFTHDNWISFMRIQREVDGYVRAVMAWAAEHMTRQALKAAGRTYLTVNVNWLLQTSTSDKSWTWQRLAEKEKIGWRLEGDTVIIKKPRTRT